MTTCGCIDNIAVCSFGLQLARDWSSLYLRLLAADTDYEREDLSEQLNRKRDQYNRHLEGDNGPWQSNQADGVR